VSKNLLTFKSHDIYNMIFGETCKSTLISRTYEYFS